MLNQLIHNWGGHHLAWGLQKSLQIPLNSLRKRMTNKSMVLSDFRDVQGKIRTCPHGGLWLIPCAGHWKSWSEFAAMRCFVTSPCTVQAMKASGFGWKKTCKKKMSERGHPHTPKVAGLVTHQSCYIINWNWNPQFSFKPKYLQGQDHSLPYHPASLWRLSYLSKCNNAPLDIFNHHWLLKKRTHINHWSVLAMDMSSNSQCIVETFQLLLCNRRKKDCVNKAPAIHQSSSDSLSIPSAYKPYPLGVLLLGGRNMDLRCWESCGFLQWA